MYIQPCEVWRRRRKWMKMSLVNTIVNLGMKKKLKTNPKEKNIRA